VNGVVRYHNLWSFYAGVTGLADAGDAPAKIDVPTLIDEKTKLCTPASIRAKQQRLSAQSLRYQEAAGARSKARPTSSRLRRGV
jgi:hypothetical protein